MIKKLIKLTVKIATEQGRVVKHDVMIDGASRFGALEPSIRNALYKKDDKLHSINIIGFEYDVCANNEAELMDVGV